MKICLDKGHSEKATIVVEMVAAIQAVVIVVAGTQRAPSCSSLAIISTLLKYSLLLRFSNLRANFTHGRNCIL
jgi:hypothetical protein